jgi:hypothetical protein
MARFLRLRTGCLRSFEILPPALMVVFHHAVLGAAMLGVVLVAWVVEEWIVVRAAQRRHEAELAYAQTAVTMGSDPAALIAALHQKELDFESGTEGGDAMHPEPQPVHRWY